MPNVKKSKTLKTVDQINEPESNNVLSSSCLNQSNVPPKNDVLDQSLNNILNKTLCRTPRYDAVISDIFADMPGSIKDTIQNKSKASNKKNTKEMDDQNIHVNHKIVMVVGMEVAKNLKKSDERRLKVDINRGNIHKSKVLLDMIKRCPHLESTIQNIINDQIKEKSIMLTDNEIHNGKCRSSKRLSNKLSSIGAIKQKNLQPEKKHEKKSAKKRKLDTRVSKDISKKSKYNKPDTSQGEDLGSDDTDDQSDDQSDDDIDQYQEDGFVTYDEEYEESGSDDFNGSDKTDNPMAELNDLYDDHISTRAKTNLNMTEDMLKNVNIKIKEIREIQSESKIDIAKVMIANFNTKDSLWFYKNIKRISLLEGQERFNLEDKIEKRYTLLISLLKTNMYVNFNTGINDRDITKDIRASKHPDRVKHMLLNKMYNLTNDSMEEYQKALNWVDTILNIPTEVKSSKQNISTSINRLYEKLHHNLHGMDDTIKHILQAVCTILSDPNNEGYILTLVGPPGVGKTTISTLIAEAIGMGFDQISCGGIADQATIVGHGSTYIGSKPGVFTQCLINNNQLDNVILLDEMDKMYDSKILPVLLHVLDRSQNNRFKDAFCPEVDIDLSKNLYIVAVNSLDSFDDALKDRLKVVYMNGYDTKQKTQICTKHIIPRLIKKTSITTEIDHQVVKRCVEYVSPGVSGVRDLERFFGDIYEKLLLVRHMDGPIFNLPVNFKSNNLEKIDMAIIQRLTGLNF